MQLVFIGRITHFQLRNRPLPGHSGGDAGVFRQKLRRRKPGLVGAHRVEPVRLADIAAEVQLIHRQHVTVDAEQRGQPDHLAEFRNRQIGGTECKEFGQTAVAAPLDPAAGGAESQPFDSAGRGSGLDFIEPRQRETFDRQKRITVKTLRLADREFSHQVTGQQKTMRIAPGAEPVEEHGPEPAADQPVTRFRERRVIKIGAQRPAGFALILGLKLRIAGNAARSLLFFEPSHVSR